MHKMIGVIILELDPFLVAIGSVFLIYWQTLEIVSASFDPKELACALLDFDLSMARGPMPKGAYFYVII